MAFGLGNNFGRLGASGKRGTVTPEVIGGVTIGDAGTGFRAGFNLNWGDDFNTRFPTWTGGTINGKYSNSPPHIGFRRESAAGPDVVIYIEPEYRGARSTSPTALGFDAASVSASVLSVTIQAIPGGLSGFLPTTYTQGGGDGSNKPQLISTAVRTWPTFMLSAAGDWIVECKLRVPAGVTRGIWPGPWITSVNWPDYGEVDICEMIKIAGGSNMTGSSTLHSSTVDGGGDNPLGIGSTGTISTSRFTMFAVRKVGTVLTLWDDEAAQGTMALRGTLSNAQVARLRGAHEFRIDNMVNPGWDSTTLTLGDYPATMEYDWIRYWAPTGSPANASMNVLPQINTTPGGSWAASIPNDATLFGGTSPDIVEAVGAFDNEDTPGMPTRNSVTKMPGGMTTNLGTRLISGTVPATEGGRVGVLYLGSFTAGGPAKRAIQYFNVAPVALGTVWSDAVVNTNDVVSKVINYTDFHSGNLGPHTYSATKTLNGTDYTISGNGTQTLTISGTAVTNEVSTFSIVCTNAIGQTTTISRQITLAASFSPGTWTSCVEWWDSSDNATVFSDSGATVQAVAGTDKARAIVGKKLGAVLSNSTSTVTSPAYQLDSIKTSLKVAKFSRANITRLVTTDATVLAQASGNDVAHALLMAVRRGTGAVSVTPANYTRTSVQTDIMRYLFSGGDAVGCTRTVNNVPINALSANSLATTDVWDIVLWHFTGTTLNVRMNGSLIASAVTLNTTAATFTQFALGAIFSVAGGAYDGTTAFDSAIGEVLLLTGGLSLADSTLAAAESYLAAKWQ